MIVHRGVIAALLAVVVAACDGTASGSTQANELESDPAAIAAVTGSPEPTDSATPRPTPEPTPPPPPPPKPKGVSLDVYNEGIEGPPGDMAGIGDFVVTVSWERPRTKGTVIRVYGVTKCFEAPADAWDEYCLRKHTPLPSRVRVLVAKAPASKGTVTFRLPLGGYGEYLSQGGRPIYSFVIAAYNKSGRSIFTIVDPGSYCASHRRCDTGTDTGG